MINFMKNFILAETANFYRSDSNRKNSGVKAIKKFIYMGGSNDADSVITKEHIDLINKDIEILWKLPAQKGIPDNVKAQAEKAIPEILSNEMCSDKTKEKYIDMAKKGIKLGNQIYTNLSFIKVLLQNSQNKYGDIKKMNKSLNIVGIVLLAAESYLTRASKSFKEAYGFNNEKAIDRQLREKDPILMSGHTHREHIEKMFDIIQFLIENSDGKFPLESSEIEKMFIYFVSKRISNLESEMLFDLIGSVEKNKRGYHNDEYLINDHSMRKFIFVSCMSKKDYVTPHDYSQKSIRCFKDLFLEINEKNNSLTLDSQSVAIRSVSSLDMEGIDTLWQISCQASNPIVQERTGYLLAITYYNYMDKKDDDKWERETSTVVRELMQIINTSGGDSYETLNRVKVLKQFADTFETLDIPQHFRSYYKKMYEAEDEDEKEEVMESGYIQFYNNWNRQIVAKFAVENKVTKEIRYIETNIKTPVYQFKREVAKQFNLKAREFEFNYNDKDSEFVKPHFDWC